jgi:microcystin-dependent protein
MEPFIGEIELFPFPFAPLGWMPCEGQLLNLMQNQALFALLGFTYGGNGTTMFALPNLLGTEPIPNTKYYIAISGYFPVKE